MSFNPFRITIRLYGTTPLFQVANLESVLNAFESITAVTPEFWSLDERVKLPYDRTELLQVTRNPDTMHGDLYLRRDSDSKYFAILRMSPREPGILVDFETDLEPDKWPLVLEMADAISAAFRPDIGTVFIWPPWKRKPWASDNDKYLEIIGRCANLSEHYEDGPKGLGMRTYFGPHYIEQFGKAFLLQTPGVEITELDWQGVQMDLSPEPWSLSVQALVTHWQQAMTHLSPAGVFAEMEITPKEQIIFRKGVRCTIGGIIQ